MTSSNQSTASQEKGAPRFVWGLGIKERIDIQEYNKKRFVEFASLHMAPGIRMLDVGAGNRTYEKCFPQVHYESCDYVQNQKASHSFLCDLNKEIPAVDDSYDAILCTQVLDDLSEPQKCLNECARILKPGGSLFLTAPLSGRVHGHPHHYFHYSGFGLQLLFERAGLEVVSILPWGGIFWCLSYFMSKLPKYLHEQYVRTEMPSTQRFWRKLVLLPLYLPSLVVCQWVLPALFFFLDPLDRKKDFTLGYGCYCRKPAAAGADSFLGGGVASEPHLAPVSSAPPSVNL